MAEIFPLDLGDSNGNVVPPKYHQVRRFSSQNPNVGSSSKAMAIGRRSSYSYSRSYSCGSVDSGSYGSSPRCSTSFSAAILFKDAKGVPVLQPLKSPSSSRSSSIDDDILNFFKCYKCYDLIPNSTKLVVLDTKLSVRKAFLALVESGVRSCPVWRSDTSSFVGLVTVDDFLKIIKQSYQGSLQDMKELDQNTLENWMQTNNLSKDLNNISPDSSLYEAISAMISNKTYRLPIMDPDTGNVLYVLSQRQLLRFLLHFVPNLQYFDHLVAPLCEAGVGTFRNVEVVTKCSKVTEAISKFVSSKISSVPVITKGGKVLDILTKYDVLQLAASHNIDNLEMTVGEALETKQTNIEGVLTCRDDDAVLSVIEKLVEHDVSQLVMTDDQEVVVGMITITDILQYLVTVHRTHMAGHQVNGARQLTNTRSRARREDSIGEEVELEEDEESPDPYKASCSPPQWFNV